MTICSFGATLANNDQQENESVMETFPDVTAEKSSLTSDIPRSVPPAAAASVDESSDLEVNAACDDIVPVTFPTAETVPLATAPTPAPMPAAWNESEATHHDLDE